MRPVILSLFDRSGNWSRPYLNAGYEVERVCLPERDVLEYARNPPITGVRGVLAAPPCTEFATSGARWWKDKPPERLEEALALIDATLAIIAVVRPAWWVIENPVGRLRKLRPQLGPPLLTFDPCDYGDGYTKRTQLFGRFKIPPFTHRRFDAPDGSKMHRLPPSEDRAHLRSETPMGFATAFFRANP